MGTNGDDYLEIHFDLGTQTGTFNFWGVQLEQNTTATALERRPIQQELDLCHRYFEAYLGTEGILFPQAPINADSGNRPEIMLFYKAKRVGPTITVSSVGHITCESPTSGASGVSTLFATYVGTGTRASNIFFAMTWSVNVPAYAFFNTTAGYIHISAEL
jgi:hypothetical protein